MGIDYTKLDWKKYAEEHELRNKYLLKEKWKRHIYVYWVAEIMKRREGGLCPKCGNREWYQIGAGFRKKWQCESCGETLTRADLQDDQKWYDYIELFAKDEIKRRKVMERRDKDIKTMIKDKI